MQRPVGEVELLIGQNYAGLHPIALENSGNLVVYQSLFASGFTLGGCHASIKPATVSWDPTVSHIRSQEVNFTRVPHTAVREYMESSDLIAPTPQIRNSCMK